MAASQKISKKSQKNLKKISKKSPLKKTKTKNRHNLRKSGESAAIMSITVTGETRHHMIIHHSGGLHIRITNSRSYKFEPAFQQVFAHGV
jgi:hypothetical protein